MKILIATITVCLLAGCAFADSPRQIDLGKQIDRWDEAVPLGNGEFGGLLWGEGREIRLSLDKGGLWDIRQHPVVHQNDWNFKTMQKQVAQGDQEAMQGKQHRSSLAGLGESSRARPGHRGSETAGRVGGTASAPVGAVDRNPAVAR